MGFILFNKSGTFDPTAYGLNPGDVIHAIVVGGGGGGCYSSQTSSYGGNGGASSFGNYLTALGGYGAYYNQNNPWRGTPTEYMTRGRTVINTSNFVSVGGTGGGGWYPGMTRGNGGQWMFPQLQISGTQYNTIHLDVPIEAPRHTGGAAGIYTYNNSTNYFSFIPRLKQNEYWNPYITSFSANQILAQFEPMLPVAGGCGIYQSNGYYDGTPYCRNVNCRNYNEGNGGLGYGAGGGSASPTTYTAGGCGGELREGNIILTSAEPIAVTVGGGGSGGGYYTSGANYAGIDGSAGAPGAAPHSYCCPGGYGEMIPTPASRYTSSSYGYYAAGGGAGGCVALWW